MTNIVKRLLPNAVHGWLGLNGELAPLGQELRVWSITRGRYLEIQLHGTTYVSDILGYHDMIYFGGGEGHEIQVHDANGVSYGSFIIEYGGIDKLNIDLGYPMQYGTIDLDIIDNYGNPINSEDMWGRIYFSTYPYRRSVGIDNGKLIKEDMIQGDFRITFHVRPDRPFIAPPDYYFSILRGQTITDTIIVERTEPTIDEGFLQITNINAPIEALEGSNVGIDLTLTNIGVADNFRYVARDNTTGEILTQGIDTFNENQSKNVGFDLIMPNYDMTINVTTEHEE